MAIRLTPRRCRNHWCPGRKRNGREASKRPGWMAKEFQLHTVPATSVLVEDKDDDILGCEPVEDALKGPLLGKDAETCATEPPGNEGVEPIRTQGFPEIVDATAVLREVCDRANSCQLPVAEVAGENENSFTLRMHTKNCLDVFYAHQRRAVLLREPGKAEELEDETRQVPVKGLRQPHDLLLRDLSPEDTAEAVAPSCVRESAIVLNR